MGVWEAGRGFTASVIPSSLLDKPSPQISKNPVDDIQNDILFIESVSAGGRLKLFVMEIEK